MGSGRLCAGTIPLLLLCLRHEICLALSSLPAENEVGIENCFELVLIHSDQRGSVQHC